ncbi:MAG: cytochrome b5-like heme/steroid binding domain-containing protein [Candidatus Paceibacterota bacterium]|jgi:cytochrome b involved in lipid metabolism
MKKTIIWTVIVVLVGGVILFSFIKKDQTPIVINSSSTQAATTGNASYTISDISQHNTQSSCWTAIDGKVYDITKLISSHPAGVNKIMKGCGIDATNIFNNVGAHNISKVSKSFVGVLK